VKQFVKKPGFDAGFFVAVGSQLTALATASALKLGLDFQKAQCVDSKV